MKRKAEMQTTLGMYRGSLMLLTDLYSLTMAQGFWKTGNHERPVVFHHFFRENPFKGGYALAAGLPYLAEWLDRWGFDASDLEYLAELQGNDEKPLFETAYLDYLEGLKFSSSISGVQEGTVVFGFEPLIRAVGPVIQSVIMEGFLLNVHNFCTLSATKASRIVRAAGADPVLEFALRRCQGIDGALTASRAAYIAGCAATSNVLAGKLFAIPVKGTHAHCWVMFFVDEEEAFFEYAKAMPNNSLFLVDTNDTIEGVKKAIKVGRWLKAHGHKLMGIRLDSGDLAWLSQKARALLDEAGFTDAVIVASNDLDEGLIESVKRQGGRVTVWGVGTKLGTCYDQPALGGVWKLGAVQETKGEAWRHAFKASENPIKVSIPGVLQTRRFYGADGKMVADAIFDEQKGFGSRFGIIDPMNPSRKKRLDPTLRHEDLLQPIFIDGRRANPLLTIEEARARAKEQLALLDATIARHENPHRYPVGIVRSVHELREQLLLQARGDETF